MKYELNDTVMFLPVTFWPKFATLCDSQPAEVLQKAHCVCKHDFN